MFLCKTSALEMADSKLRYQGLSYDEMLSDMKDVFMSGKTKACKWRISQLKAIINMLDTERTRLCDALFKDLRKVLLFIHQFN